MRLTKPKKIYAHASVCGSCTGGLRLMQIPRVYTSRKSYGFTVEHFCNSRVYSFTSLIKRSDGWYVDSPYYIASGPHRYRRLPGLLQLKVNCIDYCGRVLDAKRRLKKQIDVASKKWRTRLSPAHHYRMWRHAQFMAMDPLAETPTPWLERVKNVFK